MIDAVREAQCSTLARKGSARDEKRHRDSDRGEMRHVRELRRPTSALNGAGPLAGHASIFERVVRQKPILPYGPAGEA